MKTGNNRADSLYIHLSGEQCVYCGQRASAEDHVIPRSHIAKLLGILTLPKLVTVPACSECNSLVGAKLFKTLGAKRRYIQARLRKKYHRVLKMPNWSFREMEQITCPNLLAQIQNGLRQREVLRSRVRWRNVGNVVKTSRKKILATLLLLAVQSNFSRQRNNRGPHCMAFGQEWKSCRSTSQRNAGYFWRARRD